jgi:WD40 repeat protein
MSSDNAAHLCVGLNNGTCKIMSCKSLRLSLVHTLLLGAAAGGEREGEVARGVSCVKYSPQDSMLAVATTDNSIFVYFKSLAGYEKKRVISVSLGGLLLNMDWSLDGCYLQGATNSQVSH